MGEYADMAVEDSLCVGHMWDLYDEDYEEEDAVWIGSRRRKRNIPRCNTCHKTPLYWRQRTDKSWYLTEYNTKTKQYELHVCKFKWK